MTYIKKNKFWFWFVAALMIAVPVFVGADIHFTKQGGGGTFTGGGAAVVANVTGLRAFEPDGVDDPEVAILAGYNTASDGGEGSFYWDAASTATDDSCTIFKPTTATNGRWHRVIEDDFVNVRWCGALGNGVTNDHTAMQRTIELACDLAATSTKNTVAFFPNARYYTDNRLTVQTSASGACSNVTLQGQGTGSRFEYDFDGTTPLDGAGIAIFTLDGTSITIEKIHLKGSTSLKGFNRGIYFDGGNDIRILGNNIEGAIIGEAFGFQTGIVLTRGTENVWIEDNYIHDNGISTRTGHGIALVPADNTGANHVLIKGNRIVNPSGASNNMHNGVMAQDSTYVTVTENHIQGMTLKDDSSPSGYGIAFYGFAPGRSYGHIAANNVIKETDGTGIYVQSSPYTAITSNILEDTVRLQEDAGVLLVGAIGVNTGPATVTGNVINGIGIGNPSVNRPAGIAIQTFDEVGGLIVSGNYIENGIGTGIEFREPTVLSSISNNVIKNTRGGFAFLAATVIDYEFLTLNNNVIQRTGVISDNASGINIRNAKNCTLSSNIITRPGGHGIIAQTGTKGLVISSNVIRDASQSGAGFHGMQITGDGEHIIVGNQTNSWETPKSQTYGILENSTNNTLTENHAGGSTAGVTALGTGAVTDNNRNMP